MFEPLLKRELFVVASKRRRLDILKEGCPGRDCLRIKERSVKGAVTNRRVVNMLEFKGGLAEFKWTGVIATIKQVDERSAIIQPSATPVFQRSGNTFVKGTIEAIVR